MPDGVVVRAAPWLVHQHVIAAVSIFFGMKKLVSRALLDQLAAPVSQVDFAVHAVVDGITASGGTAEYDIAVALDFCKRVTDAAIAVQVDFEIILATDKGGLGGADDRYLSSSLPVLSKCLTE